MIQPPPNIQSANVRLRLLTADDLVMTLMWRNREEVRHWLGTSAEISLASHQAWFREHEMTDDAFMFIVEDVASSAPLGQVSIYGIDRDVGAAEIGRFIAAPGVSGKGLIREAIAALIQFAFHEMNLERLILEVVPTNARAIKLYLSLGFLAAKSKTTSAANTSMLTMALNKHT
jgi:RimJ/RimL family protein N-acetyltransferase